MSSMNISAQLGAGGGNRSFNSDFSTDYSAFL